MTIIHDCRSGASCLLVAVVALFTVRIAVAQQPTRPDTLKPARVTGMTITDSTRNAISANVGHQAVREANARDAAEIVRYVPGVDLVRRGPVGFDPVVRGLRESQVGVFIDGTPAFAGSSDRMDSPMSHLDPTAIEAIEVVKGPYALTSGGGSMAAIRVRTRDPLDASDLGTHESFTSGYDSNIRAPEASASLEMARERVGLLFESSWRTGSDYRSGDGDPVPGRFSSISERGDLSWRATTASRLTISGGYQHQGETDYPGRLMNAAYFQAFDVGARWRSEQPRWDFSVYAKGVDHDMTNAGKPAEMVDASDPAGAPMVMPDVQMRVPTTTRVVGARAALRRVIGLTAIDVGADAYRARFDATMRMFDSDGMLMEQDVVWPDATTDDAGTFVQVARPLGELFQLTASARLDLVHANAGTLSDFFRQNVSPRQSATDANPSAAVSLSRTVDDHWILSVAGGSVARSADPSERFSDRMPSTRSQLSTEFVGNPRLSPERCTQLDLAVEGRYSRATIYASGFARRIDDYITVAPTNLPPLMDWSPRTVFEYVNGTATFDGGEVGGFVRLTDALVARIDGSFLVGTDQKLHEPAPGVAPALATAALRFDSRDRRWMAESSVRISSAQHRISVARDEEATPAWTTVDVQGGREVARGVAVRIGFTNLLNRTYWDHLSALNPYTMRPVPEPGRVAFARLAVDY
jgi:iron complex outermembrane receptor protein